MPAACRRPVTRSLCKPGDNTYSLRLHISICFRESSAVWCAGFYQIRLPYKYQRSCRDQCLCSGPWLVRLHSCLARHAKLNTTDRYINIVPNLDIPVSEGHRMCNVPIPHLGVIVKYRSSLIQFSAFYGKCVQIAQEDQNEVYGWV